MSMLPFTELRLSIPYAIAQNANPLAAFTVCVIANIFVILPIFLFLDYAHSKLVRIKLYARVSEFFLRRIRPRSVKVKEKMALYGFPALMLFVAIPLPVTGAYTGTIIAWLLGLNRKKSFIAIAAGVMIAGIIVTLASSGVLAVLGL